jgi:hypothetical protein
MNITTTFLGVKIMKTKIIISIFLLLITTSGFASEAKKYYESAEFPWDCFHVASTGFGTIYLNHYFKLKWYESAIIIMTCGVMWELCDELYQEGIIRGNLDCIFDRYDGFNYKDIIRNSVGIGISFPIRIKW